MHYVFGECHLDTERYVLYRAERLVHLRAKVFDVLVYLLTHRDRVISKDELRDQLWAGQVVGDAALSSCIKAVRQAVGDDGRAQRIIATVHGRGYRFIAPVEERGQAGGRGVAPGVRQGSRSENLSGTHATAVGKRLSPFIARTQHLDHGAQLLREVLAGQPRVILIRGEAGIGKTRLLKAFQAMAHQHNIQVCYGRCHEGLTVPYMLLADSLLAYLDAARGEAASPLDTETGSPPWYRHAAADTPWTTRALGSAHLEQDKLRMFLAVSRATMQQAQRHPVAFFLDDLHWADPASLELLGYLLFTMADAVGQEPLPLCIAGTYRPLELSPQLSRFLPRFQREAICHTIDLCGFAEADMAAFIQAMELGRPSHQLLATIKQVTQGNPLFIEEIMQHLLQQRVIQQQDGALVIKTPLTQMQLPEHVTGVFTHRLEALSKPCQQVLTFAAFLGERFSFRQLCTVHELPEEALLAILEEAIEQRLLFNEEQEFQFAHPLIRNVLYHTPSAARRQRLHLRLVQAFEHLYADDIAAHVMEIANHCLGAGSLVVAEKVAAYARQAGDQAFAMFAWWHAAQYYEATLKAAESRGQVSALERATLCYRAGQAYHRAVDVESSLVYYDQAVEAYQRADDVPGLAQTLMEKSRLHYYTTTSYGVLIDVRPLEAILERLGGDEPRLRGNIAAVMAEAYWTGQRVDEAENMARYALEIGHSIRDHRLCAQASHSLALVQALGRRRIKEALACWQQALDHARQADDLWLQGLPLPRLILSLSMLGRLDEAASLVQQAQTLTRTTQDWSNSSLVLAYRTAIHVARGEFRAAEQQAQATLRMGARAHYPWGSSRVLFTLACTHALCGNWSAAEDALNMQVEPGGVFEAPSRTTQLYVKVFHQLLRAYAGRPLEEAIEPLATALTDAPHADAHPLALFCALVEIGDLRAAPNIATPAYQTLSVSVARDVLFTSGWVFLVPRVLGLVETLNGWWDEAEAHFQAAQEAASRTDAHPELGRTYLDYARMLSARGRRCDHAHALELARRAASIFNDCRMHPFAQRTEHFARLLQAHTS
jgi:DNA-binding winged helix-turn-helix (wHTH) protein/tetratricopeptide (TPR) repeat protein